MDVLLVARGIRAALGLAVLATAFLLARRRDTQPPSGAFALFLVAFGTWMLTSAIDDLVYLKRGADDPISRAMFTVNGSAAFAVEVAALNFVARLLWPGGWIARSRVAAVLLAGAWIAWTLTAFAYPRAFGSFTLDAAGSVDFRLNFLGAPAILPTFSIYAALLTWAWWQEVAPGRRRALLLVAIALLPVGAGNAFFGILGVAQNGVGGAVDPFEAPIVQGVRTLQPFLATAGLTTVAVLVVRGARQPERRGEVGVLLAFLALGAGNATIQTFVPGAVVHKEMLSVLIALAFPAIVVYGLLRGHIAGLDAKVRVTVKASTIAFVFLGIFLVVAEIAGSFFQSRYGWAFGGLAAGVALVAIHPIQRVAERVAVAAVPVERVAAAPVAHEDRLRMYREQARVAWADGNLSADERRMLNAAREHLGLTHEEADALEREAMPG